jgi:hypothetical protein
MANTISWFEIPVLDFERAKKFYSGLLSYNIQEQSWEDTKMGFLAGMDSQGISGAIVWGKGYEPSEKGTLVYLNGGEDLSGMLDKVELNGGKIILPKTLINEDYGYFAMFIDTEGNRIALHSMK